MRRSDDISLIPISHYYAYFEEFDWLGKNVLHFDKFLEHESQNYFPTADS